MPHAAARAEALHREALVVDTHVHSTSYLPRPPARALRLLNRTTMPPEVAFDAVLAAGVHAVVAKAVGDRLVTTWWARPRWEAVAAQLDSIEEETVAAGGRVVTGAAALRTARADGAFAVILGLEGADAIGSDLDRLDQLHERGVRAVVPVHLGDNQFGTTCLPWPRYVAPVPVPRCRSRGLTGLGKRAVDRMNELGIVIDVSHADSPTLRHVVERSQAPVMASHAGARGVQDFERYLSDDDIRALAGPGGLVGLWPYRHRGRGAADVDELVRHARHVAALVGPEHLCIGTDMNGVPGLMAGYRGEQDLPRVTAALLAAGFGESEVTGILGANFLRLFERVCGT